MCYTDDTNATAITDDTNATAITDATVAQQPATPSQAVIDLLMEETRLRFSLFPEKQPDLITTREQNNCLFVDVWSKSGQWIMSTETTARELQHLEKIVADPELLAKHRQFSAENLGKHK